MATVIHFVCKGWEDVFFFSFLFQSECGDVDCGRWHNECCNFDNGSKAGHQF